MKRKLYLLFLGLFLSSCFFGQTPTWSAFTTSNTSTQLCNHRVNCISFDIEGNKWFGTQGGVSKYTGTDWFNYTVADGLCDFDINCINFDGEGNTWIGTGCCLAKFDGENWTRYTPETTHNQFQESTVYAMVIDSIGNIWLGSHFNIYKYDGINFFRYPIPQFDLHSNITTMAADSNNDFWFGTRYGYIGRFDGSEFIFCDTISGLINHYITALVIDNDGNKWIGSAGGGLFKYDGTTWTQYTTSDGLANNNVASIALDSLGNKWIATFGGGISVFSESGWETYNDANSGLITDYTLSIAIDIEGIIWCGTYYGVCRYDGETWTTFQSNGLGDNVIHDIETDPDGNLWFATELGFSVFNGLDWSNYTQDDGLIYNVGYSVAIDSSMNKWFGTYFGVSRFDGNSFTNFNVDNSGLPCNWVYSIEVDENNEVWFGTIGGGAAKYDGANWSVFNKSNSGIKSDSITSILFDDDGNYWFGTWGRGVSKFNGFTWKNYNTTDGLINKYVISIAIDTTGNLWFCTDGGVSQFDGYTWINYSLMGGNAIAIDSDNKKWIAPWIGVFEFDDQNWTEYGYGSGLYNGFLNLTYGNYAEQVQSIEIDREGNKWFGLWYGISKMSINDSAIFSITPQNYSVGKEGGSVTYQVTSNVSWVDTCESNWCNIVTKATGGNKIIQLDYNWNNTDSTRIGHILVEVPGLGTKQATLTQHSDSYATIEVWPVPPNGGSVYGAGNYSYGEIATLIAIPEIGYSFQYWSENGTILSVDSIYSFTVIESRLLGAKFIQNPGIYEFDYTLPIYIFPNPAQESFTIKVGELTGSEIEVSIYNLSGFLLKKYNYDSNSTNQFDVSSLKEGCYLVQINTGKELYSRKLLIIR